MSHLSSAKWDIELDLSNYYWQNAIPIEDSAKLAICHPYIGLCVYAVSPQGLRNSAEWGSEILARVNGDMLQNKQCTIADKVYVLGNTMPQLMENFKEVLTRLGEPTKLLKLSKLLYVLKQRLFEDGLKKVVVNAY